MVKVYFMNNRHMSAVSRSTVGRHFTNSSPLVGRQSAASWPFVGLNKHNLTLQNHFKSNGQHGSLCSYVKHLLKSYSSSNWFMQIDKICCDLGVTPEKRHLQCIYSVYRWTYRSTMHVGFLQCRCVTNLTIFITAGFPRIDIKSSPPRFGTPERKVTLMQCM